MEQTHSLLKRQLRRCFGDQFRIPEEWQEFVGAVNAAYREFDADREMLERALDLSSQELLQANSEMRAIFQAIPDLLFRLDSKGTILGYEAGGATHFFLDPKDLLGKRIQDIPLKDVGEKFREVLQARGPASVGSVEYSLLIQGQRHSYEARLLPLLEDQIIVIIRDITERALAETALRTAHAELEQRVEERTAELARVNADLRAEISERKRADETLRASERQLRRITDNMLDVISEIDAQGNILYASPSHQWIIGCDPQEVLGQPIYERLHPDDTAEAILALAEALNSSVTPGPVTFRYRHAAGHYLWMECNATLLHDGAGEPIGAILCSRDVTTRKQAEQALLNSEARYRAIVEDQTELICRWQPDGTLTFVNEAYCRYFGRTRDDLIGQSFSPLIPEEDRKMIEQAAAAISPDYPVSTYEHRVILPDGSLRWQAWSDRAIYDAQGQLIEFASVGRDITERKRVEEEIKRLNADLEQRVVERTEQLTLVNASLWDEIVERRRAEVQLRESEERYRRHFENAFDVIYALDLESRVVSISPSVERVLGFRPDEIIGRSILDVPALAPEFLEQAVQDTLRVFLGEHITAEYEFSAKDGRRVQGEISAAPLLDAGNQLAGVIAVARDITDRKEAERRSTAFANLAQRLNAAASPKDAAQIIVNIAQDLLGWDAAFLDVYAPDKDLILYSALMIDTVAGERKELLIPDTNYAPTAAQRRTIDEGAQLVLLHDWDSEHGDLVSFGEGEQQTVSLMYAPIRHGARTIGVLSIQSYALDAYQQDDLATLQALADHCGAALERIEAGRALREAEARYRLLVEQIPAVTYIAAPDETGTTLYVSPQIEALVGYEQAVWQADPTLWSNALHPDDHDHVLAEVGQCAARGEPYHHEYRLIARDGHTVWVRDEARLVLDQANQPLHWQGIMHDITDRKRAEAERENLITELEGKNAELERFTYTVSHDLKAPLITIRGFLGLVERDARAEDWEHLAADMARIVEATDKMRRLLDELLELSRIGRMMNPPQAMALEKIAHEALALVQGRIEARQVQVVIETGLPIMHGDRVRLVEVVQNLIDNACKFMGDQPAPRITIGQRGIDRDGKPIVFVQDNGSGIDPQYHEKVFGLFDKLDSKSEGTGIGLALVKRIIEVHGGRIWVESAVGQGATFLFTLQTSHAA